MASAPTVSAAMIASSPPLMPDGITPCSSSYIEIPTTATTIAVLRSSSSIIIIGASPNVGVRVV